MPSAQVGAPMSQSSGKGSSSPIQTMKASEPELVSDVAQTDIREQPQPQVFPAMMQPNAGQNGQYQPMGKGGSVSFPGQGGQPRMGQPNNYSNTVGPWDNANIQPRQTQSGKGKGY